MLFNIKIVYPPNMAEFIPDRDNDILSSNSTSNSSSSPSTSSILSDASYFRLPIAITDTEDSSD